MSVILNVKKKQGWEEVWPKIHFFGIYDGHGGAQCADFLKQNLHQNIFDNEHFPSDIVKAIREGCYKTEEDFLQQVLKGFRVDQSGSCALVSLIVDDMIYVVNVGDSRAFVSQKQGLICQDMSRDHKPESISEKRRIEKHGGSVAQSQAYGNSKILQQTLNIKIPYRVYPGGLSVSRSFGDISAKLEKYGGKKGVLIAEPEIKQIQITQDLDFLFMGCDGIYDVFSSDEVNSLLWEVIQNENDNMPVQMVERCLNRTMQRQGFDNLTAIVIGLNLLS